MTKKQPKYRGRRKGCAEIWLGEDERSPEGLCSFSRIRIRTSYGKWSWGYADEDWCPAKPCWLSVFDGTPPITAMRMYDKEEGLTTVFLGYVKDTE